jgi:lipopolysaccharide export system protein LptA
MRSAWPLLGLLSLGALPAVLALTMPRPAPASAAGVPPSVAASPSGSDASTAAPAGPDAGMVTIESDSQQADNRTGVVTATGNVRITYPDRRMVATSRQAQYYSKEGRLVLTGDVDVIDEDGQRIRAERLVYRLDSERLVAEPQSGRQVYSRLRLQPSQPGGTATPAPALLP